MATKTRTVPIGKQIDAMFDLREKKRALEASIKDLEGQIANAESTLMESMKKEGMEKATGTRASISISKNTVCNVVDWDTFGAYVIKNKFLHLLQRRVSDPAYRELLEKGKAVPGTEPFEKERLNLRALSAS